MLLHACAGSGIDFDIMSGEKAASIYNLSVSAAWRGETMYRTDGWSSSAPPSPPADVSISMEGTVEFFNGYTAQMAGSYSSATNQKTFWLSHEGGWAPNSSDLGEMGEQMVTPTMSGSVVMGGGVIFRATISANYYQPITIGPSWLPLVRIAGFDDLTKGPEVTMGINLEDPNWRSKRLRRNMTFIFAGTLSFPVLPLPTMGVSCRFAPWLTPRRLSSFSTPSLPHSLSHSFRTTRRVQPDVPTTCTYRTPRPFALFNGTLFKLIIPQIEGTSTIGNGLYDWKMRTRTPAVAGIPGALISARADRPPPLP